jgi:dihydrolipoyl dehydrogenase
MKYDCIILGTGPAGFYSALSCAKKGYKTAIIENKIIGGTGFRTGCLPIKRNLDVLRKVEEAIKVSAHGIKKNPDFENKLIYENETYMNAVEDLIKKRFKQADIDIFLGNGKFLNANSYLINDITLETRYFIIATGTSPTSMPGIDLDGLNVISHIEALKLKKLPAEMIIIGGNVEGIEMASLFATLGVKITVIELLEEILDGTDRDLIKPLMDDLLLKGVTFLNNVKAESVHTVGNITTVLLNSGKKVTANMVLVTGLRRMNIPDGIETTGINYNNNGIPVNNHLQSNISNIFAAGDINGIHGMAHIAIQQGMFITDGIAGKNVIRDYSLLPRAIFTLPEIAGAGKQEWELKQEGISYKVTSYPLKETWRGLSKNTDSGFIKILLNKDDILIGIWMTGSNASEILSDSGILVGKKLDRSVILDNLFIHPTVGEGIIEALFKL